MINKIKKITEILLKDYFKRLNIFRNGKLNKKSTILWLVIIVMISISYLSYGIIDKVASTENPMIFFRIYIPIVLIFLLLEIITVSINTLYYSKDIKEFLSLPIKPLELLIAKLNLAMVIIYLFEMLLLLIPIIIFGTYVEKKIIFYLASILILILLPVFFMIIINTIIIIGMYFSKYVKNKNIFQTILVFIITLIFSTFIINNLENVFLDISNNITIMEIAKRIDEMLLVNNYIEILEQKNIVINFIKIIIPNILLLFLYMYIAKHIYLNIILNLTTSTSETNKNKKLNFKYEKRNKKIYYLKNEIFKIFKNSTFCVEYIIRYVILVIIILFILSNLLPLFMESINNQDMINEIGEENVKLQSLCMIVMIIYLITGFSNLSITGISRDGKNAIFCKYIPLDLYKQFKIKNVPQITINTLTIINALLVIYIKIPNISISYYMYAFVILMLLNFINSYTMLVLDCMKPNINWENETILLKENTNKIYQYCFSIGTALILQYFTKIFRDIPVNISILSIIIILLSIFIFISIIIKKNINKIFNKIY